MLQAKSYKTLTEITELIHHPRFSTRYRNFREWGGADVIITANPIMQNTTKTVVTTRHALALSWLFCQLRDYTILSELIPKYELYGRLAQAALQYQYNNMTPEELQQFSPFEQQNLTRFLNTGSDKFRQKVIVKNNGCQVNLSAGDREYPQGLLMAVLQEVEQISYTSFSKDKSNYWELRKVESGQEIENQTAQSLQRVFMYGSNLDCDRLRSRIKNWDGKYLRAVLPGYELRFNKRLKIGGVAANVMPHSTRKVWGIIVELETDDLNCLDQREGYPSHYNRHECVVYTENLRKINAQVYIACPEHITEGQLPSYEYLEYIIKGGNNCGLPYDYVQAIKGLGQKVG
ncbi:gamma-glutamylcyclotransferase family protein [Aerosakkonemataceae cyanobacterium BLCC-F50]|uniref:Gamma-glutamylcyclotransferase family protein n=1 Tax=Floridaenema flaviceps BLCC-F50 TaxID=3153642 RepID=A0ABV4XI20_9CYAN